MTQMNSKVRINAVYVVKNEWPLLAVTISHALTHYADKVLIIDTGSQDGTFQGIKVLQSLWAGRIELYRCKQEIFDQAPLTNLLIEMSKENRADWTMVLDADEFFVHENYLEFFSKLSDTDEIWSSYAIKVMNFIVDEDHDDFNLKNFQEIAYRVPGMSPSQISEDDFVNRVLSGEVPLQYICTPDKILVRNSHDIFIAQGAHQVVFGDGIYWGKHDSSSSSGGFLGGMICHLRYTSEYRLSTRKKREFFDQQKTTARLNVEDFKNQSPFFLREMAVLTLENREKWLQTGVIVANNVLAESLAPVIHRLEEIWPKLTDASFSPDAANSFPDSLDMKVVSKLIRKYHSRAQGMWDRTGGEN
jgi:hypothetical protein